MEEIKTIGTDGKYIIVNPGFVATLTDKELVEVLRHEVEHVKASKYARKGLLRLFKLGK